MFSMPPTTIIEGVPCTATPFWGFSPSTVTNDEDSLDFERLYHSLSRSTKLYRLFLQRSVKTHISMNEWQRVDLKIVTEMGLLSNAISSTNKLRLKASLLIQDTEGGWYQDPTLMKQMEIRGIPWDEWDTNQEHPVVPSTRASWPGFDGGSVGGLEYRLCGTTTLHTPVYLYIQVATSAHSPSSVLPLALGPIYFTPQILPTELWGVDQSVSQIECHQIHRALVSTPFPKRHFLLREQWNCGTPGKLWDSAIVLSDMFSHWFMSHPKGLAKLRIVDLSAGTGFLGLFIASLYSSSPYAPSITLTDIDSSLAIIHENHQLNPCKNVPVTIQPLWWGNTDHANNVLNGRPVDIVIASDVLYNDTDFPSLIQTLKDLSTVKQTLIYLGYKRRGFSQKQEDSFFSQCSVYFHVHPYYIYDLDQENVMWEKQDGPQSHTIDAFNTSLDGLSGFYDILKETNVQIYRLILKSLE